MLLVSGDLTKDGELEGHKEFSARLQQVQKDVPGMKVYVINGNHDVRNENARTSTPPTARPFPQRAPSPRISHLFTTLFTPTRA